MLLDGAHYHAGMDEPSLHAAQSAQAPSDESLMGAYAGGDMQAFEQLYNRHERALWRFIFRSVAHLHSPQDVADELMQEVWFAVARHAAAYEPGVNQARFKTWLFTLARNRSIDHLRALASRGGVGNTHASLDESNDEDQSLHEQIAADSGFGPMQQLASREQGRLLIEAIEELPAEQREAFLLQVEGDMSVQEIAEATGVGLETAKSRLRYARKQLKARLVVMMDEAKDTA
jgi:RNA polymerase sigma factor (sigma-70 family)